jgi:hypothetical protein
VPIYRVAECYVREMRPEFAVMCRAVLDSALQEILTDEAVLKRVGGDTATLERRIQAAYSVGIFDDSSFKSANVVREAGNTAAHLTPGLETPMDDILVDVTRACCR